MSLDFTLTIPSNFQWNEPIAKPFISPTCVNSSRVASIAISIPVSSIAPNSSRFKRLCEYFSESLHRIYSFCRMFFYSTINPTVSKDELLKIYSGLGAEKWRECIDGAFQDKGKFVFDQGLHGGTVEPGFIGSMEKAFEFVADGLNRKVDAWWYLQLHQRTCGHFNGDPTAFLMGQERVGVFRNRNVGALFSNGVYKVTKEALEEFKALEQEIKQLFGSTYGLGTFEDRGQGALFLTYTSMSEKQVETLFNYFLNNFYQEIEQATTSDQKLWAIAKLHQRLEWLHPVLDGTSRTSIAFLNKNLVDYGFHPALLDNPHVSSSYGLKQWFEYLKSGLVKWEVKRAAVAAG